MNKYGIAEAKQRHILILKLQFKVILLSKKVVAEIYTHTNNLWWGFLFYTFFIAEWSLSSPFFQRAKKTDYCFNFWLPRYEWIWTSFNMLTWCVYLTSCEFSIKIYCPFFQEICRSWYVKTLPCCLFYVMPIFSPKL